MGQYIIKERFNEENFRTEKAIFYVDDNGNEIQISKWWKSVSEDGLVKGENEYYTAQRDDGKLAIFHKDNPEEPISKWFNGFIIKNSDYYIAIEGKKLPYYYIFHKDFKNFWIYYTKNYNQAFHLIFKFKGKNPIDVLFKYRGIC